MAYPPYDSTVLVLWLSMSSSNGRKFNKEPREKETGEKRAKGKYNKVYQGWKGGEESQG